MTDAEGFKGAGLVLYHNRPPGGEGGQWWVTTQTLDKLLIEFWLLFSLRVPQDCFSSVPLLAHDPDGDHVKCSFAPDATIPANVSLDEVVSAWTRFPSKENVFQVSC